MAEKRLSERGNEYDVFYCTEDAQRGIVEWLLEVEGRQFPIDLKERAIKLKQDIPAVFLSLKDKDMPVLAKVVAAVAVAYALSPIGLMPDFIPVLGYLDDVILLPALTVLAVKLISEKVWERNRACSVGMWEDGKPKKWYYVVPIITIWPLLILLIIWKCL